MEIYFNSGCLKILCDLEKLASKHNCIVHFNVVHHNIKEFNIEECNGYTPAVMQELKEKGYYHELNGEAMALCLELVDNKIKHVQPQKRLVFVDGYERTQYGFNYRYNDATDNNLSDEAEHFLEGIYEDLDCDDTFTTYTLRHPLRYTRIIGFEKKEYPNVSCPEMALEVFSDLVCDYLGEDKIN